MRWYILHLSRINSTKSQMDSSTATRADEGRKARAHLDLCVPVVPLLPLLEHRNLINLDLESLSELVRAGEDAMLLDQAGKGGVNEKVSSSI